MTEPTKEQVENRLRGVYKTKEGRFRTHFYVKGTMYEIGTYDTEEEAFLEFSKNYKEWFGVSPRKKRNQIRDGKSKHPLYSFWKGIIFRCLNPKCKYKKYYMDLGITVCDDWLNNFWKFADDMGPRPSSRHSIDRIDGTKGYYKENCRWGTLEQQGLNKKKRKTNKDLPMGVAKSIKCNSYYSQLAVNGKNVYIGSFKSEHEAHLAYLVMYKEWHGFYPKYIEPPKELKHKGDL